MFSANFTQELRQNIALDRVDLSDRHGHVCRDLPGREDFQ